MESMRRLGVVLLCHFFSVCFCIMTQYVMVGHLSNRTCPANVTEFQQVADTQISCLWLCSEKHKCTAVIHAKSTKTCYGLGKLHDPENCNVKIQGGMYYAKTGVWDSFSFQGSVYIYSVQSGVSFKKAEKQCRKFGAELASLTTESEFDYVLRKLPTGLYWFGTQVVNNTVWKWFDGTVMEDWVWEDPNVPVGSDSCTILSTRYHSAWKMPCFAPVDVTCEIKDLN